MNLQAEIDDWIIDQHICDEDGVGCEIEEYYRDYGSGKQRYFRCKFKRESADKLLKLFDKSVMEAIGEDEITPNTEINKEETITRDQLLEIVTRDHLRYRQRQTWNKIKSGGLEK